MGQEFEVSWTAVSTTTNYQLEQGYAASFPDTSPVSEGTALSTYETPLTPGSAYTLFYRARACNSGGCSGWSAVKAVLVTPNTQCTHPPCHPPVGGATSATASGGGASGGDPTVTWNALDDAQTITTASTTLNLARNTPTLSLHAHR